MLLGNGTPEYKAVLQNAAENIGVSDSVIFCGGVHNVCDYLSAFDVFAFPSLREGTPLALLEAQSNGLPCIISEYVPADAQLTDLVQVIPLENREGWVNSLCGGKRTYLDYSEDIAARGYHAKDAYLPIYQTYRR